MINIGKGLILEIFSNLDDYLLLKLVLRRTLLEA